MAELVRPTTPAAVQKNTAAARPRDQAGGLYARLRLQYECGLTRTSQATASGNSIRQQR